MCSLPSSPCALLSCTSGFFSSIVRPCKYLQPQTEQSTGFCPFLGSLSPTEGPCGSPPRSLSQGDSCLSLELGKFLKLAYLTCLPVKDTQCPLSQLLGQASSHSLLCLGLLQGPPCPLTCRETGSQSSGSPPYPSLSRTGKAGVGRAGQGKAGQGRPAGLCLFWEFSS